MCVCGVQGGAGAAGSAVSGPNSCCNLWIFLKRGGRTARSDVAGVPFRPQGAVGVWPSCDSDAIPRCALLPRAGVPDLGCGIRARMCVAQLSCDFPCVLAEGARLSMPFALALTVLRVSVRRSYPRPSKKTKNPENPPLEQNHRTKKQKKSSQHNGCSRCPCRRRCSRCCWPRPPRFGLALCRRP